MISNTYCERVEIYPLASKKKLVWDNRKRGAKKIKQLQEILSKYDENIEVYVTSDFKVTLVREVRSEFISNYDEDGSLDSQENIIVLKGLVLWNQLWNN